MACFSPGAVRGEARKGFAQLEVAVPSSPETDVLAEEEPVGVIIGMDPVGAGNAVTAVDLVFFR
jgi:hypothetical protein